MEQKLIFNDGTEVRGHLLESGERLFLYMYGNDMAGLFALLNNAENVSAIVYEGYGERVTVRGYNHLCCISEETGGMISAVLKKI